MVCEGTGVSRSSNVVPTILAIYVAVAVMPGPAVRLVSEKI